MIIRTKSGAEAAIFGLLAFIPLSGAAAIVKRPPLPEAYTYLCGVPGYYTGYQEVCDARQKYLDYSRPLTFIPLNDHYGQCVDIDWWSKPLMGYAFRGRSCPDGYYMVNYVERACGRSGFADQFYGPDEYCKASLRIIDRYADQPKQCPAAGNPIYPLTGVKRQPVDLSLNVAGLSLSIAFDNRRHIPVVDDFTPFNVDPPPSFGADWSGSFHKVLARQSTSSSLKNLAAHRGQGVWETFETQDEVIFSGAPSSDQQITAVSGAFRLIDREASSFEKYSNTGQLSEIAFATGAKASFTYSAGVVAGVSPVSGLLIKVSDQFGRAIQFNYELPDGVDVSRIYKIIGPDGQEIGVGYDAAGNLASLTWPDGKARTFLYERADLPWALTGISDERDKRYATFGYDTFGRAVSTEHAGGTNKYVASWTTPPSWLVTETIDEAAGVIWRDHTWTLPLGTLLQDPLGNVAGLGTALVNGMPRQVTRSQPGGSGCAASDSSLSYDSRGNVASQVDFNGVRSCRAYASDRNVESYRVEGLGKSDACPADWPGYQVDPDKAQRKISTKWHPLWKLEAQRAEPKRLTTTVYNGQKDPIKNDGLDVICASTAPALPDGSKIAVVCTRYEQSTEDATGNQGFDAVARETRKWSYTYNQYGQVLTETDPRGKVTNHDYWSDNSFTGGGNAARGHQIGDLKTVTNALGQKTEHLEYNQRGQVLTMKHANGSLEQRVYHPRGWLSSVTQVPVGGGAGEVTQYEYFDNGLVKKVTQPDGSFARYTWDDAQRLTDVADSVGNKVHYELDNAGNRKSEEFLDPQGGLAKSITRTFDALGRMQSSTGAR